MTSRIVLITGANSGVGYAASQVLTEASENIHVIMASRSIEKVKAAKSEIESSGIKGTLEALQLDITDEDSIAKAVKHVEEKHGRLDVLVNNAAVGVRDPNLKVRMTRTFNTNVLGSAMVAEAFRPLLFKSQNPYSIFVTSGVGSFTLMLTGSHKMQYDDAYRMSKAALNMIAMCEHRDFGPEGLKVFAMCPGFVVSNLRGTSDEARNPGGQAQDPRTSGELLLKIINGERDNERGAVTQKDGTWPW